MPIVTLNEQFVKSASCPIGKSKVEYYSDHTAVTGLVLECRASGGKTYYLRYRDPHKRLRQFKIGNAKDISFEKAKQTAQRLRARVVLGESPSEERKAVRSVPTLKAFAEERYLPYAKGYKKRWDSDEAILRLHLLPKFGQRHLDELTHTEIVEFHKAKRAKGYSPAHSNQIVTLLRRMYNLAKQWGIPGADVNPAQGVPLFEPNDARERYLSPEETQRLLAAVQRSENQQLKFIVPLLILTGARKRELLDAIWTEFDLKRRTWTIRVSKSGKTRRVPLSETVIQILAQVPRLSDYVVPNPKTKLPFVSIFGAWERRQAQGGNAGVADA